MTTVNVSFEETATVEQRKAAINRRLEFFKPFELIKIMITPIYEDQKARYTGGITQMITAASVHITIKMKKI